MEAILDVNASECVLVMLKERRAESWKNKLYSIWVSCISGVV